VFTRCSVEDLYVEISFGIVKNIHTVQSLYKFTVRYETMQLGKRIRYSYCESSHRSGKMFPHYFFQTDSAVPRASYSKGTVGLFHAV
jgi:hypothetical protein